MLQTVHGVSQWKKIRKEREREGDCGYGKEDPAEKDHGKSEEVGHGHGFKDFLHSYRNEDSKERESDAGKDDCKRKRKGIMNRKAYDWDKEDRDDQGDHQAKHGTSKGLPEKDGSDLQWGQKESLESPDSLLKGDHNGSPGSR